jgi:hypothetical protein
MDLSNGFGFSLSGRACQEIRTDHLQAVTARFVGTQHQGCSVERLLDDRYLALVDLEVAAPNPPVSPAVLSTTADSRAAV